MGHNVYLHIYAVQEANRQYDAGSLPSMMEMQNSKNGAKCKDIIDAIFAAPSKEEALAIINYYHTYWMEILGNHGQIGKKAKNASTYADKLFEAVEDDMQEDIDRETVSPNFNPDELWWQLDKM